MICANCRHEDHEALCKDCGEPMPVDALSLDEQAIERIRAACEEPHRFIPRDGYTLPRWISRAVVAALRNEQEGTTDAGESA